MPKKRRTVTIQDVAKKAGVSVSTVSRVLNEKADVASETQDRILSVIDDLDYAANLAARSMRSRKKNLVGLIMPDIAFPFAIEVMKGVNRAIAESEFDLLVYTTGDVRKERTGLSRTEIRFSADKFHIGWRHSRCAGGGRDQQRRTHRLD